LTSRCKASSRHTHTLAYLVSTPYHLVISAPGELATDRLEPGVTQDASFVEHRHDQVKDLHMYNMHMFDCLAS